MGRGGSKRRGGGQVVRQAAAQPRSGDAQPGLDVRGRPRRGADFPTRPDGIRPAAERGYAMAQTISAGCISRGTACRKTMSRRCAVSRGGGARLSNGAVQPRLDVRARPRRRAKRSRGGARYRAAAEQGDSAAQNNLGWMYKEGRGVSQDDAEAVLVSQGGRTGESVGAEQPRLDVSARPGRAARRQGGGVVLSPGGQGHAGDEQSRLDVSGRPRRCRATIAGRSNGICGRPSSVMRPPRTISAGCIRKDAASRRP